MKIGGWKPHFSEKSWILALTKYGFPWEEAGLNPNLLVKF